MFSDKLNFFIFGASKWGYLILGENYKIEKISSGTNIFSDNTAFLDYFDEKNKKILTKFLTFKEEGMKLHNVITKSGVPLELLIVKNAQTVVYYKNLSSQIEAWNKLYFFYRSFVNNKQPTFATDKDGTIIAVNKAFLDFYGFNESEVIGKKPNILKSFRQSPSTYKVMWNTLLDPNIGFYSGNIYNRKRDGTEVLVTANISSVYNFQNELLGFVATHSDITKIREYEEKLKIKNEEINTVHEELLKILSILSHDIKGQIGSIINYLELMKCSKNIDNNIEKALNIAYSLNKFIKDSINLAKIDKEMNKLNISRCHILNLLKHVIESLEINAAKKEVKIELKINGEDKIIGCEIIRTEEILLNLIDNAIKYTRSNEEIVIEYSITDKDVVINIIDSGPGIPEEMIKKIFEPFYTDGTKVDSFGLGLYIVKKYVDLHGWKIDVENRKDKKGTIFRLIIDTTKNKLPSTFLAVILDPANEFIDLVENALRSYSVQLYKTTNLYEFKKLYKLEMPELIFINVNYIIDDLDEFIKEIKNPSNKIVGIYDDEPVIIKNLDMLFKASLLNSKAIKELLFL